MSVAAENPGSLVLQRSRVIVVILPDDGRDRVLIRTLLEEKGITRADSLSCRGINVVQAAKAKGGRLPESDLARRVRIVVPEDQADELFDFIFEQAGLDRPGSGGMFMGKTMLCTDYTLPGDIPMEPPPG